MKRMREAEIQRAGRLEVGRIPGICLWRNNVGFTGHSSACPQCGHVQQDEDGPRVRYGLCKGSSDLIGLDYELGGRFIALEFKTPVGRLTPEQQMFLELVGKRRGFPAVARSPEDAVAAVKAAREGAESYGI